MLFNDISNKVEETKFIDKNTILEYVSEEDIFQLVFKDEPVEYEYITSPLREDNNPGCWFEVDLVSNKLKFKDFGNGYGKPLDCFDVVKDYYDLPNFYETLKFVFDTLILGKKLLRKPKRDFSKPKTKRLLKRKEIIVATRDFINADAYFWGKYEITKKQLIEDKVFPIIKYKLMNTRSGNHIITPNTVTYAYLGFEEGRKKIYSPYKKGKGKWMTTCIPNDITGLNTLDLFGERVFIKKSYKDWRVIKNQGEQAIGFQNEGAFPDMDLLIPKIKNYQKVIIFFDNDKVGIEASIKLKAILEQHIPTKIKRINLPVQMLSEGISDPSDLIHKKSRLELQKFLNKI